MGADEYSYSVTLTITDPSGSADPAAGTYTLIRGTAVTVAAPDVTALTASGRTRFELTSITGTGSAPAQTAGTSVSFTLTADSTVSFHWDAEYLLSLKTVGAGAIKDATGQPVTEGWYPDGTALVLRAVPEPGSRFASWAGNVPADVEGPEFPVTLAAPLHAIALFRGVPAGKGTGAGGPPDYLFTLKAGWNLISFPVLPAAGRDKLPTWDGAEGILAHSGCLESWSRNSLWRLERWGSDLQPVPTVQPAYGEVYWAYYKAAAGEPQTVTLCVPGDGIRERVADPSDEGYDAAFGTIEAAGGWNAVSFDTSDPMALPEGTVWRWEPEREAYALVCSQLPGAGHSVPARVTHGLGYMAFFGHSVSIPRPSSLDSDGDGLASIWERFYGCDEANPDSDGDGLPDGCEAAQGTALTPQDPDADPDSDGLTNAQECALGTRFDEPDTDSDGLPDAWEAAHGLDPSLADSDGNEVDDGADDPDQDGLTSAQEYALGTDPCSADTDQDGLGDATEAAVGSTTSPVDADTDDDGLGDGAELSRVPATDPADPDSDNDGLADGWEAAHTGLDPLSVDTLQDAISAAEDGETIVVYPGDYAVASLDLGGRAITLTSSDPEDAAVVADTILRGNGTDPVVWFHSGETAQARLIGFTITGGGTSGVLIDSASPAILRNTIAGNTTSSSGGGIRCTEGSPLISRCLIYGNRAALAGGGIALSLDLGTLVRNTLVAGNRAGTGASGVRDGGGLWVESAYPSGSGPATPAATVLFCTLADNRCPAGSGGALAAGSAARVEVSSSILWNNQADACPGIYAAAGATLTEAYNCTADPLFAQVGAWVGDDYAPGDYHVKSPAGRYEDGAWTTEDNGEPSPAVDAGDPALPCADETQPNGGRANAGMYGDTAEASRTSLLAILVLPGGVLTVPVSTETLVGVATLGVKLSRQVPEPLTLAVVAEEGSGLTVRNLAGQAISELVFTSRNWDCPQTIAVGTTTATPASCTLAFSAAGAQDVTVTVCKASSTERPVVTSCYPSSGVPVPSASAPVLVSLVCVTPDGWQSPHVYVVGATGETDVTSEIGMAANALTWRLEAGTGGDFVYRIVWALAADPNTSVEQRLGFTLDRTIPSTTATPAGGRYPQGQTVHVALSSSEPATIYYSTDGFPPLAGAANTEVYTGTPVELDATANLQFFAVDQAGNQEPTQSALYILGDVPEAPSGLTATYDATTREVVLSGNAPAYSVQRYCVYRALGVREAGVLKAAHEAGVAPPPQLRLAVRVEPAGETVAIRDGSVVPTAQYCYAVTAVAELTGQESASGLPAVADVVADSPAPTEPECRQRALAWLIGKQDDEGWWGDEERKRFLVTCQVARALHTAGDSLAHRAALFYVRGHAGGDNRHLAEAVLTLSQPRSGLTPVPVRDLAARLRANAWLVGDATTSWVAGWGLEQHHMPDPVTTPTAILALLREGSALSTGDAYGVYATTFNGVPLLPCAGSTDWYGWLPLGTPATCPSALNRGARRAAGYDDGTIDYTSASRPAGVAVQCPSEVAAVLLWDPPASDETLRALLLGWQRIDGSWNGDPGLTALCVEALWGGAQ